MQYGRQLVVAATALVLGAVLFWLLLPTSSDVPGPGIDAEAPTARTAADPEPREAGADEAEPEPAPAEAADAGGPAGRPRVPASIEVPQERIPRSTRPFDSPAQASAFIEDKVVGLLASVDPSLAGVDLERECTPDGRVCTFYGPWPGDDFLKDWLRAISDGRTGIEALDGVRFSTFKPIDEGGEKRLMLRAHAP